MNSYIISSKNFNSAKTEIAKILEGERVSKFDQEEFVFEKDLGITDVRNIQKNIYLKPFKGEKKSTTLILHKKATIEAQNSLLKLLEEPPKSSLIFIVSTNYYDFLPTILSRVKIIDLKRESKHDNLGLEQINEIEGIGDALYLAQILAKDKTKAISWLENTIISTRSQMLSNITNKNISLKYKNQIERLEETYLDLKNTNINTRLALENLFLNI